MTSAVPTSPTPARGRVGQSGVATLGDLTFRVAPSQIAYEYHMDTAVINTIGGRVVQVYGATLGDLTVQGMFGARYMSGNTRPIGATSMEMARSFATEVQKMVDAQGARPSNDQLTRKDRTPMNPPIRFTYTGDGIHQWDFSVYVKGLHDIADPAYAVSHKTGKYSYGYDLQLFIVEDHTGIPTRIATDDFIARLSKGVGWQRTEYNGPMTNDELKKYLQENSPDGTIHKLILKEFEDAAKGQSPAPGTLAKSPVPGMGATTTAAAGANPGAAGPPGTPSAPPAPAPPAPPPAPARTPEQDAYERLTHTGKYAPIPGLTR